MIRGGHAGRGVAERNELRQVPSGSKEYGWKEIKVSALGGAGGERSRTTSDVRRILERGESGAEELNG